MQRMNYSFLKGCVKVSKENYRSLNNELRNFLGCKTLQYYYVKRKRYVDMPEHVKKGIENIFAKYGVEDPAEIWDIRPVSDGN